MGWKKFFLGEKMPDKNDPQYHDRYLREVAAGRLFAHKIGIGWLSARLQYYGSKHRKVFLSVVFGIVVSCFVWNACLLFCAVYQDAAAGRRAVAVSRLDSVMKHRKDIKRNEP